MKIQSIIVLLTIIIVLNISSGFAYENINAGEIDLSPTIQILDSLGSDVDTNNPLINNFDLFLKISMTNSYDFWICYESLSYNIQVSREIDNKGDFYIQDLLEIKNCLKPNTKQDFIIRFEEYNNIDSDERIDTWKIQPNIYVNEVSCYRTYNIKESICSTYTSISSTGNIKKFEVIKEELKTQPITGNILSNVWEWLTIGYNWIYGLSGFILTVGGAYLLLKKLKNNR